MEYISACNSLQCFTDTSFCYKEGGDILNVRDICIYLSVVSMFKAKAFTYEARVAAE